MYVKPKTMSILCILVSTSGKSQQLKVNLDEKCIMSFTGELTQVFRFEGQDTTMTLSNSCIVFLLHFQNNCGTHFVTSFCGSLVQTFRFSVVKGCKPHLTLACTLQYIHTDTGVIERSVSSLPPSSSPTLTSSTPLNQGFADSLSLCLSFSISCLLGSTGGSNCHIWRIFRATFVFIKPTAQLHQMNRKMTVVHRGTLKNIYLNICVRLE